MKGIFTIFQEKKFLQDSLLFWIYYKYFKNIKDHFSILFYLGRDYTR